MPSYEVLDEKELQKRATLFFKDYPKEKVVFISEDGFCFAASSKKHGENYCNGKPIKLIEIKKAVKK